MFIQYVKLIQKAAYSTNSYNVGITFECFYAVLCINHEHVVDIFIVYKREKVLPGY